VHKKVRRKINLRNCKFKNVRLETIDYQWNRYILTCLQLCKFTSSLQNDTMKGPEFLKYLNPVLTTLQANGGAGNSTDVIEQVIDKLGITEQELEEATSNGQSRIRN